nr:MAG TPA: hypothetical protein [Caudoviricetes sp.]
MFRLFCGGWCPLAFGGCYPPVFVCGGWCFEAG